MRNNDWVPTLERWKTGSELTKDDVLFDQNGNPNPIIDLIYTRLPLKKVLLNDGTNIICHDKEILYVYNMKSNINTTRSKPFSIQNYKDYNLKIEDGINNALCINLTKVVNYINQHLDYDPYILGCLIGNAQKDKKSEETFIELFGELKIPEEYLTAKEGNRLKLLNGMMDTNGIFNLVYKNCEFKLKKPDLIQDVKTLIRSLGCLMTLKEYPGYKHRYSCIFNFPINPFNDSDESYKYFYQNMNHRITISNILEIGDGDVVIPITKNPQYLQGKSFYLKSNEL